jgi:hypothetical protein
LVLSDKLSADLAERRVMVPAHDGRVEIERVELRCEQSNLVLTHLTQKGRGESLLAEKSNTAAAR